MCIAVGGKRMVRARGIIACALRRIRTEKDTSGILYFIYPVGIIGCLDNQMLRRIAVGEINRLLTVFQHHDTAVAKGTFCDFLARKPFQFLANGLQHRLDNRFRIGYQHRLAVCPMFRLRKEICGNKSRIGRCICHNLHLRRACRHINCHVAQADQLFGCSYILITGPEYLIDLRHRLRPVSHGRNRLTTAYFEYATDARHLRSKQNRRMHTPFPIGRRAKHNLPTTGNPRRNCQHQNGREQRSRPARNIQSDLLYRNRFLPTNDTRSCFHLTRNKTLRGMKRFDIHLCLANRLLQIVRQQCFRFAHLCIRNLQLLERIQVHLIELLFQTKECRISLLPYRIKYSLYCTEQSRHIQRRPLRQRLPSLPRWIFNYFHNCQLLIVNCQF